MKTVSFGVLLSAVAKSGTGTYSGELSGEYPVIWHKREGDVVVEGEALADIETEKVLLGITAPVSGRIVSVCGNGWEPNGKTEVTSHGEEILLPALGMIETEEVTGSLPSQEDARAHPLEALEAEASQSELPPSENISRARVTPLARKIAETEGVDLAQVNGSGISGRICAEDVRNARGETSEIRAVPAARALVREKGIDLTGISGSGDGGLVLYKDVQNAVALKEHLEPAAEALRVATKTGDSVIPSSFRRKAIARLLQRSWREVPHAGDKTLPVEITDLISFHKRVAKVWLVATGVKLRYDSYLAYLATKLLQEPRFSILNGYWDEDAKGKVLNPHINMGITVSVSDKKDPQEDYLVIPVIHHAEELDFPSFAKRAHELIESALLGKLSVGDTRGLTVTFNNTGVLGGTDPSSILPYVMEDGGIEHPSAFLFNLTAFERNDEKVYTRIAFRFDHRVCLTGATPSAFAEELKKKIEAPQKPEDFFEVFGLA